MKKLFTFQNLAAFTLGILVFVLLNLLGVTGWSYFLALALLLLAATAAMAGLAMIRTPRLRAVQRYIRLMAAGKYPEVQADLLARQARGDAAPEFSMLLSSVEAHFGHGDAAAPLALDALDRMRREGLCQKSDPQSQGLCDLATIAVYDAWMAQGRFIEAADLLRERLPRAAHPNFVTMVIAWAYFLGGDEASARTFLGQVKAPGAGRPAQQLRPKYSLMWAYLRHVLLGQDTQRDLRQFAASLPHWDAEATRNAQNPYGLHLRPVLDDIRRLLAGDTPPAA